jgi:hypothetical protein
MIPHFIQRQHVLQAIADVDAHGFPDYRQPTRYDLLHAGRRYPPKYLVTLACRYATGAEIPAIQFNGGAETNEYLGRLGFEIVNK